LRDIFSAAATATTVGRVSKTYLKINIIHYSKPRTSIAKMSNPLDIAQQIKMDVLPLWQAIVDQRALVAGLQAEIDVLAADAQAKLMTRMEKTRLMNDAAAIIRQKQEEMLTLVDKWGPQIVIP
jgi:hypothetical protein